MTQLLQNALFGTALILAAALLRRALGGRLLPEARLVLWFVCLVRLLAPAFPDSALSLWGLLPRVSTSTPSPGGGPGNLPVVNVPAPGAVSSGATPVEHTFPWEAALLAVWIGVGLALAVRYALRWGRTRRAVAQAAPLPRDDPRYAPLPRCARLREGAMDGAPLTFGAARPTVVLSPGLSGEALECVLVHEGVHASRRDNLWHYAMALALAVYWWNPAVWLMARLLRRDIELACDRAAVRKLGAEKRARYAETLVALATTGAEPAFCQTFGRKAAEERIVSVMKFKKTTVLGVLLSLVLVAGVTVAFASAPRAESKAPVDEPTVAEPAASEDPATVPIVAEPAVSEKDIEELPTADYVTYPGAAADDVRARYGELLTRLVSEGTVTQAEAKTLRGNLEKWIAQVDSGELDELQFNPAGAGEIFAVAKGGGPVAAEQPAPAEEEIPEFVPDYDPEVEDSIPEAPAAEEQPVAVDLPLQIPVCPVEGCTVRGVHYHDGVLYRCNGAHCGGVCDGSCLGAGWNQPDTAPQPGGGYGHHGAGHHGTGNGNGYHGGRN